MSSFLTLCKPRARSEQLAVRTVLDEITGRFQVFQVFSSFSCHCQMEHSWETYIKPRVGSVCFLCETMSYMVALFFLETRILFASVFHDSAFLNSSLLSFKTSASEKQKSFLHPFLFPPLSKSSTFKREKNASFSSGIDEECLLFAALPWPVRDTCHICVSCRPCLTALPVCNAVPHLFMAFKRLC